MFCMGGHTRVSRKREPGVVGRLRVVCSGCVRLGREALADAKEHWVRVLQPRESESPRVEANTGTCERRRRR